MMNYCSITKLNAYYRLMRFDKPIGIYLLLWPTLWALWIAAGGFPNGRILCIFVLGTIVMRAGGCVINDIADRHIDGLVERTRYRPLAQKKLSVSEASVALCLLLAFAGFLACQLNQLTLLLSLMGVGLTLLYPFCKRFMAMPQCVLGLAFAWAVPMAFAAQKGFIPGQAWFLFVLVCIWTVGYDTMYAMTDRKDDCQIGVKSSAILLGSYDRCFIGVIQVGLCAGLYGLGFSLHLTTPYYIALTITIGLMFFQQRLLKTHEPANCLRAFYVSHWIGFAIFLGIVFTYLDKL